LSREQSTAEVSLGKCIQTHPMMKGVKQLSGTTNIVLVTPCAKGATVVAEYGNGNLLIVEKNINGAKVIGMNIFFPSFEQTPNRDEFTEMFWNFSDGSRLIENVFDYACTPQF